NIAHANSVLPLSYYRAIEGEDLITFAVAADLAAYERITGRTTARSPVIQDVLAIARQVLDTFVVPQPGGGWLFPPGVRPDHPDFLYAGNTARPANPHPL